MERIYFKNVDRWVFRIDGDIYMMGKDRDGLEVIGENYDQ